MDTRLTQYLAVDLGTTFTAAMVGTEAGVETVQLGPDNPTMPSVIAVDGDGEVIVGYEAEQMMAERPDVGVREVKRRFGDTTPIVIEGRPFGPDQLMVEILRHVARVACGGETEGVRLVLTHPANWGAYKLELLSNVGVQAGFVDVQLVPEPVAAALEVIKSTDLDPGATVAVYDFGGGTFDAAVVCAAEPVRLLGQPSGLERLGGIDVDQLVMAHALTSAAVDRSALSSDDVEIRRNLAALRADCTAAKEALSSSADVVIALTLPGAHTEVRLTRTELESVLVHQIDDTVATLERVVASAGLEPDDLAAIVLVGGSSQIPLVGDRLRARFQRPVVHGSDPKLVVVGGALRYAAGAILSGHSAETLDTAPVESIPVVAAVPAGSAGSAKRASSQRKERQANEPERSSSGRARRIGAKAAAGGLAAAAAATAGLVFSEEIAAALDGDDGDGDAAADDGAGVDAAVGVARLVEEGLDDAAQAMVDAAFDGLIAQDPALQSAGSEGAGQASAAQEMVEAAFDGLIAQDSVARSEDSDTSGRAGAAQAMVDAAFDGLIAQDPAARSEDSDDYGLADAIAARSADVESSGGASAGGRASMPDIQSAVTAEPVVATVAHRTGSSPASPAPVQPQQRSGESLDAFDDMPTVSTAQQSRSFYAPRSAPSQQFSDVNVAATSAPSAQPADVPVAAATVSEGDVTDGAAQARVGPDVPDQGGLDQEVPDQDVPDQDGIDPDGADPHGFDAMRGQLLERVAAFEPPAGASANQVDEFRAELMGMISRYRPQSGTSTEDALADLRYEFDQRVRDFTQDQKISALVDEQLKDRAATASDAQSGGDTGSEMAGAAEAALAEPGADQATDPDAEPAPSDELPTEPSVLGYATSHGVAGDRTEIRDALEAALTEPVTESDNATGADNGEDSSTLLLPVLDVDLGDESASQPDAATARGGGLFNVFERLGFEAADTTPPGEIDSDAQARLIAETVALAESTALDAQAEAEARSALADPLDETRWPGAPVDLGDESAGQTDAESGRGGGLFDVFETLEAQGGVNTPRDPPYSILMPDGSKAAIDYFVDPINAPVVSSPESEIAPEASDASEPVMPDPIDLGGIFDLASTTYVGGIAKPEPEGILMPDGSREFIGSVGSPPQPDSVDVQVNTAPVSPNSVSDIAPETPAPGAPGGLDSFVEPDYTYEPADQPFAPQVPEPEPVLITSLYDDLASDIVPDTPTTMDF